MLKLLCLGLFLALCFAEGDYIVKKVLPFETRAKRDHAMRNVQVRAGEPRIVGGHKVPSPNPYPWVANFVYGCDSVGYFLCGTSLVQQNISLCAAHCWPYECPDAEIRGVVAIGLDLDSPDHIVTSGIEVALHPGYDADTFHNDISMIFFKDESFDTVPKFPHLPSSIVDDGVSVEAAGWGSTKSGGDVSNDLREVTLKIQEDSNCENIYVDFVPESQVCAGARNKDTCQGDSGGPLFETTDCCPFPSSLLQGITSYGLECASTKYAVYTEVYDYLDWINSVITAQSFQNNLNAESCCGCTGDVDDADPNDCGASQLTGFVSLLFFVILAALF